MSCSATLGAAFFTALIRAWVSLTPVPRPSVSMLASTLPVEPRTALRTTLDDR